MPFRSVVNGAVHATSPGHVGLPSVPQVPPWQPPPEHVPALLLHVPPEAMQRFVLLSQHPPDAHAFPAQHASPGPPHAMHFWFWSHASPDWVQMVRCPFESRQQSCPAPPQVPQLPPRHVLPNEPPHVVPLTMHRLFAQHAPAVVHVAFAQHAWPEPPHCTNEPLLHTWPALPFAPEGIQVPLPESKHAPA
jgi:hypothetical protein